MLGWLDGFRGSNLSWPWPGALVRIRWGPQEPREQGHRLGLGRFKQVFSFVALRGICPSLTERANHEVTDSLMRPVKSKGHGIWVSICFWTLRHFWPLTDYCVVVYFLCQKERNRNYVQRLTPFSSDFNMMISHFGCETASIRD